MALSPKETSRHELLSEGELGDKCAWLGEQMTAMVDEGQLTAKEQKQVVAQLQDKLTKIQEALAELGENKPKKLANLTKQAEMVMAKIEAVQQIKPITRQGPNDRELARLRTLMGNLDKLESKKNKTGSDVQKLLARPGIQRKIDVILAEDKSWFKDA